MHACDHHDNLAVDAEVHDIRETTQKRSPSVSTDNWVSKRVFCDGIDYCIYRRQKLMTQAWALSFVPKKRVVDVRRCRRADNALHQSERLRIRSRTSFQGMPTGPSRSS